MKAIWSALLFVSLTACGDDSASIIGSSRSGDQLDEKAIERGLLPDPDRRGLVGRFETRSDLGVDKFCATENGRFGLLAVFGPESKCEGQGRAELNGERITLTFEGKKSCSFEADYDGIVIQFPGNIGPGCASYCSPRANMSGTQYHLVEKGNESAGTVLGRDIERLCP